MSLKLLNSNNKAIQTADPGTQFQHFIRDQDLDLTEEQQVIAKKINEVIRGSQKVNICQL